MTPEKIEQMKEALANASKKPWSAFTDDSRDTLHTNIVGVVPNTHCVLSLSGHHKSEPNVTLATLAPDMAAHIIALEARVKAAEDLAEAVDDMHDISGMSTFAVTSRLAAYRATGEAP